MHEYENPADGADATDDAEPDRIVIAVVRSGGIAGMRRRWRAEILVSSWTPDAIHGPRGACATRSFLPTP